MNKEEHTYIESYLDGELDWELLVDYVGEDMARGVRIAENHFRENIDLDEHIKNIVADSIAMNGEIAKQIQKTYGASRMGDICGNK